MLAVWSKGQKHKIPFNILNMYIESLNCVCVCLWDTQKHSHEYLQNKIFTVWKYLYCGKNERIKIKHAILKERKENSWTKKFKFYLSLLPGMYRRIGDNKYIKEP